MAGFPTTSQRTGQIAKQPRPGVALDINVIEELITKLHGNVSRVADVLGSQRGVIRRIIDKHPHLQDVLKQSRERQLDELEQSCFERAIETNDTQLQMFLLKTQGKSRGYSMDEGREAAQGIASAAFAFIMNKAKVPSSIPVDDTTPPTITLEHDSQNTSTHTPQHDS